MWGISFSCLTNCSSVPIHTYLVSNTHLHKTWELSHVVMKSEIQLQRLHIFQYSVTLLLSKICYKKCSIKTCIDSPHQAQCLCFLHVRPGTVLEVLLQSAGIAAMLCTAKWETHLILLSLTPPLGWGWKSCQATMISDFGGRVGKGHA